MKKALPQILDCLKKIMSKPFMVEAQSGAGLSCPEKAGII